MPFCVTHLFTTYRPSGVLGIWGEGLFIFRDLAGEQAHTFGDLGSTAKKSKNKYQASILSDSLKCRPYINVIYFLFLYISFQKIPIGLYGSFLFRNIPFDYLEGG